MSLREGRGVNIHMFCARRMGLLQSTLKTLDDLGLDIQQAVISCFNGFALDVFRAEVCVSNKIITLLDDQLRTKATVFYFIQGCKFSIPAVACGVKKRKTDVFLKLNLYQVV